MNSYVMRFISGKYQGGEFPLPGDSEIVIGRASDLDMVLVEDMVSRRHARIVNQGGRIRIEDLGSTNGTFVNGERVSQSDLHEGDRVLIGTNIIKLVAAERAATGRGFAPVQPNHPAQTTLEPPSNRRTGQPRSMSGAIDDVPLPDLLQLFGSSRKSGTLVVTTDTDVGKIFLEKGIIVSASVNEGAVLTPQQAIYRILGWQHGSFYMEPAGDNVLPNDMAMSVEGALMESMRILDEIARTGIPPMLSRISVPVPLPGPLRDLNPEELDVLQVAMGQVQLEAVFNNCSVDDIAIANAILSLIERKYLAVIPPVPM